MWCLIIMQTKGNSAPILMMKYWIIRTLLRSLSVVELSGGVKSNNSNTEAQHHIYQNYTKIWWKYSKSYQKFQRNKYYSPFFLVKYLMPTVNPLFDNICYYCSIDNDIYFERLLCHESKYIRCQHACIKWPIHTHIQTPYTCIYANKVIKCNSLV